MTDATIVPTNRVARGRLMKAEDPAVQNAIIQAIGLGATIKQACSIAGIAPDTFRRWRKLASEETEPYHTLFLELEMSADRAIARKLAVIDQASQGGTWQAAAWWLERNYPDMYALVNRTEFTGKNGEPLKVVLEWPD